MFTRVHLVLIRSFSLREYLAMFKKTVSMHEVFLQRLAAHPVLRVDNNFRIFLEYKEDVWRLRSQTFASLLTGLSRSS